MKEKSKSVQCGHTKKCGWAGTEDDFVYTETPRDTRLMVQHGVHSRTASCPKCGGIEFYYPRKKLISAQPLNAASHEKPN